MQLRRRRFLSALASGLAAGAALGCRMPAPPDSASERPAEPRPSDPRPAEPLPPDPRPAEPRPGEPRRPAALAALAATVVPRASTEIRISSVAPTPSTVAVDGGRALERTIDLFLRQQRGSFGVAVRDLTGSVAVELGARTRFTLASLYKVVLMYEVLRRVGEGRLRLDDQIKTASEYSFGEPEGGVPPDTRVTVDEAVAAMIEVSSNGAALALIDLVRPDALRAAPGLLSMSDTTIDPQPTDEPGHYWVEAFGSARDLAELFGRLGRGQLVGPALDQRMIGYLAGQRIKDRLPLLLPAGTPIGHKTGDFESFTHDAGLVLLPGRPYVIAVLAEGDSVTEGKAVVAELSRLTYAYFNGGS